MCVELIYDSLVFVSFTDCTFAIHLWAKMILINSLLRSLIRSVLRHNSMCYDLRTMRSSSSLMMHVISFTLVPHTHAHSLSAAINISLRLFDVARSTTAQSHLAQCVCLLFSRSYFVSPLSTNAALFFLSFYEFTSGAHKARVGSKMKNILITSTTSRSIHRATYTIRRDTFLVSLNDLLFTIHHLRFTENLICPETLHWNRWFHALICVSLRLWLCGCECTEYVCDSPTTTAYFQL